LLSLSLGRSRSGTIAKKSIAKKSIAKKFGALT